MNEHVAGATEPVNDSISSVQRRQQGQRGFLITSLSTVARITEISLLCTPNSRDCHSTRALSHLPPAAPIQEAYGHWLTMHLENTGTNELPGQIAEKSQNWFTQHESFPLHMLPPPPPFLFSFSFFPPN